MCTVYSVHIYIYCRASHTGDAIRVMYSSVSVGVVHVLCPCAQLQSTLWCSFHTAACNHLITDILLLVVAVVVVLVVLVVLVLVLVVAVVVVAAIVVFLATHLIFAFLSAPKNHQIGGVFAYFWKPSEFGARNTANTDVFAPRKPKTTVFTMLFASGNKNHGIYSVFVTLVFTQFSPCCKM